MKDKGEARAPPYWSRGGDGPLRPSGLWRGLRRGASGGWPEGHRPPVRPPSRRRKGGELPLSSPLHGLYGVGKEEPPSRAPTPFSGEDGAPLWGPTTHSSGGGGCEPTALALMMPPPPPP
ncbi:hypothetical protein Sjap_016943 [Stephania japonica]|uniref:Uncharacterized protein n=1 Tax=Stephania japonica TaxID=461633 RepID=A0AAP0I590_9MAGN